MLRLTLLILLVSSLTVGALAGCSSGTATVAAPAVSADMSRAEETPEQSPVAADRVMVYDADLVVDADEPDSLVVRVGRHARSLGGYVLESRVQEITVRVPSARLDEALQRAAALGEVVDRRVVGQDVTERYRDLELRLKSARASRDRYLDLLERATNVKETLLVEKELERLDQVIERLQGQLNQLRERVRFSTLMVRHQNPMEPGPIGWVLTKVGQGVKWLFVRD